MLITLATFINVLTFWFWFKATPLIAAGEFQNYFSLITPLAGLVLAAALFLLTAIFVENPWLVFGLTMLGSGVPYLFIPANTTIIILFFASLALAFSAIYRTRKEFNLSLGFSLSKIARAGLPIYFTISSLIISVFYFTNIREEKNISALLPKSALNFTLKKLPGSIESLSGLPTGFFELLNPEATVDEALLKLIEKRLKDQNIDVSKLSHQELLQAVSSQREEFTKILEIKLEGQEKVGDVFYDMISQRIEKLFGPYKKYLPAVSAFAFFLAFKTFTLPLYYLTYLFTFLLLKIMTLSKIVTKETKQIEVEKLTL